MESLTSFQRQIINECKQKVNGGLSLPMGSGKTLIGLQLSLEITQPYEQILIVCSKSLIGSWEHEIKKFYKDTLKYKILLNVGDTSTFKLKDKYKILLTTPQVLSKAFSQYNLDDRFSITENINNFTTQIRYYNPKTPMLSATEGLGTIFSKLWGVLLIDEVQNYTNIKTLQAKSMSCICSKSRWLLSGTIFSEPKDERVLGFFCILNAPGTPRTLPDTKKLLTSRHFDGLNKYLVIRNTNENFENPPELIKHIISHTLTKDEENIYLRMKEVSKKITERITNSKLVRDHETTKMMNSYLLAMVTYLRQSVVCPTLPLSNVFLNLADHKNSSELSKLILSEMETLNISNFLNNDENVKSSRIKQCLKSLEDHIFDRVVVFSCFRTSLDILDHYIDKKYRKVYVITPKDSAQERHQIIERFSRSENGVLLLTFEIGSVGLNLQCANTVLIMDYWWNDGTTQQSIARVFRYGQKQTVNVYFYTSNMGIENILFKKQQDKLAMLNDMKTGCIKQQNIIKFNLQEILKMIDQEDNTKLLKDINNITNNQKEKKKEKN